MQNKSFTLEYCATRAVIRIVVPGKLFLRGNKINKTRPLEKFAALIIASYAKWYITRAKSNFRDAVLRVRAYGSTLFPSHERPYVYVLKYNACAIPLRSHGCIPLYELIYSDGFSEGCNAPVPQGRGFLSCLRCSP